MAEPGNKRVTIKDIANEVGASLGTVNKALTGKSGISEKRRMEIRRVAQEMGYEVNSVAQIMSRKPITIGVVMPVLDEDTYFKGMKIGMEREFEHLKKYKVNSVYYTITKEQNSMNIDSFTAWLKKYQPAAICFCPRRFDYIKKMVKCVMQQGIPLFLSGGGIEPPEECVTMVSVDAYLSGRMAADFFHCVHGKQIHAAVFGNSMENIMVVKKVSAFTQWLEHYGVGKPIILEDHDNKTEARQLIEQLYKDHPETNCIYVTNANSIPVCEFIEEHGLKDAITLVCTDYFKGLNRYIEQDIVKATLLQNEAEVGRTIVSKAYDYLVKNHTYGNENQEPIKRIYVKPEFCLKSNFMND